MDVQMLVCAALKRSYHSCIIEEKNKIQRQTRVAISLQEHKGFENGNKRILTFKTSYKYAIYNVWMLICIESIYWQETYLLLITTFKNEH